MLLLGINRKILKNSPGCRDIFTSYEFGQDTTGVSSAGKALND